MEDVLGVMVEDFDSRWDDYWHYDIRVKLAADMPEYRKRFKYDQLAYWTALKMCSVVAAADEAPSVFKANREALDSTLNSQGGYVTVEAVLAEQVSS